MFGTLHTNLWKTWTKWLDKQLEDAVACGITYLNDTQSVNVLYEAVLSLQQEVWVTLASVLGNEKKSTNEVNFCFQKISTDNYILKKVCFFDLWSSFKTKLQPSYKFLFKILREKLQGSGKECQFLENLRKTCCLVKCLAGKVQSLGFCCFNW